MTSHKQSSMEACYEPIFTFIQKSMNGSFKHGEEIHVYNNEWPLLADSGSPLTPSWRSVTDPFQTLS